jgi:hypothetical protein
MIFQYLGMASSRLGRDAEAVDRFGSLLAVDSLFRFPRNEDAAVLRNFRAAREARNSPVTVTPAVPPAAPAPEDPAPAAAVAPDPGPAIPAAPAPSLAAAARGAVPPPDSPLRDRGGDGRPAMNLAFGAVPFGGGWMARERMGYGLSLGLVQAGGLLLSIYASEMQSKAQDDREGLQPGERPAAVRWQWVQAVSLSTAVGAYFYSIFASGGD